MNPADLLHEIRDISLFVETILKVLLGTGLALVPLILIGYELQSKKKI